MIIRNNFNDKNANPLDDYTGIGKGSHSLDKELESRGQRFTRYADDVVIVLKSKAAATRVMYSITNWIEKKLGLKVNATKTKITPPSKLKYLGFGFWKDKGTWKARPHQNSVMEFKRKLKALCKRSWSIDLTYTE